MKTLLAAGLVVASTLLACADGAGRLPFLSGPEPGAGTADPTEAEAVVAALFDGMRAGDSTAVRNLFMPGATLTSSFEREGIPVSQGGAIDGFVRAVGSPREEVWDEKVYGLQTLIDDHLAVVWAPYSFYRGEQFSHCGVNVFTLMEREDGWKILHLADTRRPDRCLNETSG